MNEQKKYEFTGEIKVVFGINFKQIRAIINFGCVVAGEIGGWIECEENLSQSGNAWVYGDARVYGNARVSGDARVYGNARVSGNARVYGDASVSGNAWVYGDARVYGNAWVSGDARVSGNASVSGNADVKKDDDYMVIGGAGRYNRFTTFFKCRDKTIKVICGCFFGTIIEFRAKVKETHKGNKHEKVYLAMADMAELQIGNDEVEK
ncbi:MAG: hypothetical protein ACLTF8_01675 [Veillonella parvula]|uniref:hypothetical protein n=1 Tax=Veillonella parvula TaxID=29466 RepID=UPI003991BFFF